MIRTAFVGFGVSGINIHYPQIKNNDQYKIVAVITNNQETINFLREFEPTVSIFSTLESLIEFNEFDLAIISTPNIFHYQYTKELLKHGKHVLCEKPFVESKKEALELFDLAHKSNCLLRVYHNRQFDSSILTAKKLIESNILGELSYVTFRYDVSKSLFRGNWREKVAPMSGRYYDLAPHLLFYAFMLFGRPYYAELKLFKDNSKSVVDDHFEIYLEYQSLHVILGSKMNMKKIVPQIELVGKTLTYQMLKFGYPNKITSKDEIDETPKESYLINEKSKKYYPMVSGAHYLFLYDLARDIKSLPKHDYQEELSIMVIEIMETMYSEWILINSIE